MRFQKVSSVLLSWILWSGSLSSSFAQETGYTRMLDMRQRQELKKGIQREKERNTQFSARVAAKEKELHEAPIKARIQARAEAPKTLGGDGEVLYTNIAGTKIKAHAGQGYDPMIEMTMMDADFENQLDSQGQFQAIHEAEKGIEKGKTTLEQFHDKFSEFIARGSSDPEVRKALQTPQGQVLLKKHKKMTSYLTMSSEFEDCVTADKKYKLFDLLEMYDSSFLNLEDRYRALMSQVDVAEVSVDCAILNSQNIVDDGMFGANGFANKLMAHVKSQTDKEIHDEMMKKSLENASQAYSNFRAAYDRNWLKDIVEDKEFAPPESAIDMSEEEFERVMADKRIAMARKIRSHIGTKDIEEICTDENGKNVCNDLQYNTYRKLISENVQKALKGSLLPIEVDGKPLKGYDPLSFHKQNRKRADSITFESLSL